MAQYLAQPEADHDYRGGYQPERCRSHCFIRPDGRHGEAPDIKRHQYGDRRGADPCSPVPGGSFHVQGGEEPDRDYGTIGEPEYPWCGKKLRVRPRGLWKQVRGRLVLGSGPRNGKKVFRSGRTCCNWSVSWLRTEKRDRRGQKVGQIPECQNRFRGGACGPGSRWITG